MSARPQERLNQINDRGNELDRGSACQWSRNNLVKRHPVSFVRRLRAGCSNSRSVYPWKWCSLRRIRVHDQSQASNEGLTEVHLLGVRSVPGHSGVDELFTE